MCSARPFLNKFLSGDQSIGLHQLESSTMVLHHVFVVVKKNNAKQTHVPQKNQTTANMEISLTQHEPKQEDLIYESHKDKRNQNHKERQMNAEVYIPPETTKR